MTHHRSIRLVLPAALLAVALAAGTAHAYRFIQNTGVGRFSAGALVTCSNPTGFTHWTTANIPWRLNTANQGSGKTTAISSALASWTAVSSAPHNLTYAGTTTSGFVTNGVNTVLWANGNGCTGGCLAITALVLASGPPITETDISFNNSYSWNTNGTDYDVQAVATHEFGHTLGLHHTNVTSTPRPTMYAYYFGTGGRSLESDDRSGLQCSASRYPLSEAQQIVQGGADTQSMQPLSTELALTLASRPRPGGALLRFAVPREGNVKLQVFDIAGRRIATLVDGFRTVGEHEIAWDGTGEAGRVGSGMYFARITGAGEQARATVILAE